MLVIPNKKVVVLRLRDPNKVLNVIPTARMITVKGRQLVVVPHRLTETKVLRNLGFNVPSPILYYYNWPGQVTPFVAQKEAAAFLSLHSRAYNLSELGTGKSLAALWAYDYLRSIKAVKKVLITSPLSTLERTWADEIFNHFPHLTCAVLHGTRAKRSAMLEQDVDVYIVNHDGVKIIAPYLAKRDDINLVIVDEISQMARNASTDRWKALNEIVNKQMPRMCWGLTGTPVPNSPVDAWAQCKIVTPSTVPPYYNRFRDLTMRQVSTFTWVPREEAVEIVRTAMQPAVRFTRDECIDLPPLLYETRCVAFTPEQEKAYKEMAQHLYTQAEAGEISAVNEAVKMQRLLQICCGAAYSPTGEEVVIPAHPRIKAVKEAIEGAEGKVIVFVPFVAALRVVAEELSKHFTIGVVHGSISKHQRDVVFNAFQKSEHPRVLVAQPAAMSHGLTLTAANTIIWYAPVVNYDIFEQANGRIQRPGQKRNTFVIMLEGGSIEKRVYERLRTKQKLQGVLLEEIKAMRHLH